ncbi:MAG: HNH endonuclease [Edwardsiella phage MSW-3]|nr:MAG: HNH endonuclease [Edwardsiella phage MSW-3]
MIKRTPPVATYIGKKCKRGHTLRYKANNVCVKCSRMHRRMRERSGERNAMKHAKPDDFTHRVMVFGNPVRVTI